MDITPVSQFPIIHCRETLRRLPQSSDA